MGRKRKENSDRDFFVVVMRVINDACGIWGCSISDYWKKEIIADDTAYMDFSFLVLEDGDIILNEDNANVRKDYSLMCRYLNSTKVERIKLRKKNPDRSFIFGCLDEAIKLRREKLLKEIALQCSEEVADIYRKKKGM